MKLINQRHVAALNVVLRQETVAKITSSRSINLVSGVCVYRKSNIMITLSLVLGLIFLKIEGKGNVSFCFCKHFDKILLSKRIGIFIRKIILAHWLFNKIIIDY